MTSLSTFLRLLLLLLYTSEIFPQPQLTGCLDRCGNVTIPYPFGLAKGCYRSQQFLVHCNVSDSGSPTPYLWGWPITRFLPDASELQVLESVTRSCHNETRRSPMVKTELQFPPHFTISHTRNSFYGVGCGTYATFLDPRFSDQSSGPWGFSWTGVCISKCDDNSADFLSRKNTTTCSGFGCCRSSIPEGARNMSLYLTMERNDTKWYSSRYLCSYAFIAENNCFEISPNSSLGLLGGRNRLPMVVNWEMSDGPCTAKSVACGAFTQCIETNRHKKAYICRCLQGYNGNPYGYGCRDIDECERNPCTAGTCINTQGSYHCSPTNRSTSTLKGWVIGLSGAIGLLLLCFIPVLLRLRRRTGGRTLAEQDQTGRIYSLKEIMDATDSLDEAKIIGQGGFGIVYQGTLQDGTTIAVKKLCSTSSHGKEQYLSEVSVLSTKRHQNLVRMLGWCVEENFLIYEFVENGSLDKYLFGPEESQQRLDWPARMNLCVGIAKGLCFLHEGPLEIAHGDIKPANILLDNDLNARITDFGLAKIADVRTRIMPGNAPPGTLGYVAPEYALKAEFSLMVDNYSYGILILELLSGKRHTGHIGGLVLWARESQENLLALMDPKLEGGYNNEEAIRAARVAILCTSRSPEKRPPMSDIVKMLQGEAPIPDFDPNGEYDEEAGPEVASMFEDILRLAQGNE